MKFKDYSMGTSDRVIFFLTDPKLGITVEIGKDRSFETAYQHRAKQLKKLFAQNLINGCTITAKRTKIHETAIHADIKDLKKLEKL